MKEFIDYFWKNKGFKYDPNNSHIFDYYHILMMIFVGAVFLVFWLIGKKINKKERLLVVVSLLLLVLEILRAVNMQVIFKYSLFESFNFHLCSFAVYIGILAGLIRKKTFFEMMFIPTAIGGLIALIIPYGILPWWNVFSFNPVQSYLSHILIVFMLIYAIKYKIFAVRFKRVYVPIISTLTIIGIIHLINLYKVEHYPNSFTNYFWTRYPDALFPVINTWIFPYHLILLTALLLVFGVFFFYLASKWSLIIKNSKQEKFWDKVTTPTIS